MLTTLDRYLLGKLVTTLVPALLVVSFLMFVGGAWRLMQREDLALAQLALALPWVLPSLLPFLLPLAFVVTITLVYGRLVADLEATACYALGVSWRSLARPAWLLSLPLGLAVLALTTSVVPYADQMRRAAGNAEYLQLAGLGQGEHLSHRFNSRALQVYVRRYGPEGLEGIVIHKDVAVGPQARIRVHHFHVTARRGRMEVEPESALVQMVLEDVHLTMRPHGFEPGAGPGPIRLHLDRYIQSMGVIGPRRVKVVDFTSLQIRRVVAAQERLLMIGALGGGAAGAVAGKSALRLYDAGSELAIRAALALACPLLALLITPFTLVLDARNALVPFALGLLGSALAFFAMTLLGRSLAEALGQPWPVFLGCIVTGVLGLGMCALAERR